ncbi:Na+/H+ antiporter NhaC family protein [Fusibacter sp. 3D3]|uniref:Na+/H+ antiporter NhaC family protein n=1 Tax=Fusibacter sp. 3D3 TaxID=1048380 RepID=UPI000852AB83|nr:Na+/H+ antiporter NhaC family protein [Fusibacter sp. 3D3]GAU77917.1 Na+/H+ antiporter NhaC [Fusibacter sp. 3D3]
MTLIEPKKKRKAYIVISGLIISVTLAISLDVPLYFAILSTVILAYTLSTHKADVPELVLHNLIAIRKTVILLFLISITLPLMMGCGALPTFIVHFSEMMIGQNLLLAAFVLATLLSMLLGTAIGTLTILIPLFMSLAFQMDIALPLLTGALLSGAYFGDRTSPLASGLHLASSVTHTDFRKNMPLLLKSSIIPYVITLIIFYMMGKPFIIDAQMLIQNTVIATVFGIKFYLLLPLIMMILLLIFKVPINRVLTLVAITSAFLLYAKGAATRELVDYMLYGYHTDHLILGSMLKTTGLFSMVNVLLVILLSACLNGILEADLLIDVIIEPFMKNVKTEAQLIRNTALLGLVLSMITCSQAMTAMITGKYLKDKYDAFQVPRSLLVMAIANVGLNVVGLIPWNVNGLVIKQLTGISAVQYVPFTFFLTLLSLFTILIYPFWRPFMHKSAKTIKEIT